MLVAVSTNAAIISGFVGPSTTRPPRTRRMKTFVPGSIWRRDGCDASEMVLPSAKARAMDSWNLHRFIHRVFDLQF